MHRNEKILSFANANISIKPYSIKVGRFEVISKLIDL